MLRKTRIILKRYLTLFIVFFIITEVVLFSVNNIIGFIDTQEKSNSIYSQNAINFTIDNLDNHLDLNSITKYFSKNSQSFLSIYLQSKINNKFFVQAILKGKDSEVDYTLKNGREITSKEYKLGSNVAIVKENFINDMQKDNLIIEKKGEKYFYYCGELFKIVGIIAVDKNKSYNDVYINLNSILNNNNISLSIINYTYLLDVGENTQKLINSFCRKYTGVNVDIKKVKSTKFDIISSLQINRFYIIATILLIIVSILTLINVILLWIDNRKKELGIRQLIGATKISLVKLLIKEFSFCTIIASMLALSIFKIIEFFGICGQYMYANISFHFEVISGIVILVVLFLEASIILIKPLLKLNKLQINEIIRGEIK